MPVDFSILDDGTIVRYVLSEPWSYEEYAPAESQDIAHRDSVEHTVHNLTIARVRSVPLGLLQTRNAPTFTHRTAGHLAIVGPHKIVQLFAQTIIRLANYDRARFFETEEEALTYLRELILKEESAS
jgi:hypothetical protein